MIVDFFDRLVAIARFRLAMLTTFNLIDLVLVTAVYFVLLTLIRKSRAAALLRGVIVGLLCLIMTIYL